MKIGRQQHRSSAISTSNPHAIVVRGRDLTGDLIGSLSFTEYFFLLVTGVAPTAAQRTMLDAALVAIAEHGLVPSVQASRLTLAAAPDALQGAVAAGILGCGSVILGAAETAGRFYAEIVAVAGGGESAEAAGARDAVQRLFAAKQPIPGYGHPLHKHRDPRTVRLFGLARELGIAGAHTRVAELVEEVIPSVTGRRLPLNVSGALAGTLLDAGVPVRILKGIPILARTAGLLAHLAEEMERPIGYVLSHHAAEAIQYDGTLPDGFVPGESGE